jgi:hypothetical protein
MVTFLKAKGEYVHGKWFCCEEHAYKDPQTKQMIDLLAKGIEFDNDKRE